MQKRRGAGCGSCKTDLKKGAAYIVQCHGLRPPPVLSRGLGTAGVLCRLPLCRALSLVPIRPAFFALLRWAGLQVVRLVSVEEVLRNIKGGLQLTKKVGRLAWVCLLF